MFGLNHLPLDAVGNATFLEATRARYVLRTSGDNNESDCLGGDNHYRSPIMLARSSDKLICKELPHTPLSCSSPLSDGKEERPEAAKGKGREIVTKSRPWPQAISKPITPY
jgi:hypothetical protein